MSKENEASEKIVLALVRVRYSYRQSDPRRSLCLSSLTAYTCWRNQWRGQLIGTGYLDTTGSGIRMIGRQRAAPGKCIGSNSLSRAESDAGRSLSTPIINGITELDSPTRAIGRNMNGGRIGNNYRSTARQPLNGRRTHRHANIRDLKRRQRCTLPCWPNK
jgi:hypothetical protein